MNGILIFPTANDMLTALGLADPDPAFTKLYQDAHCENLNRNADAAWARVQAHHAVMIARIRAEREQ